jgi:hypothetical protein
MNKLIIYNPNKYVVPVIIKDDSKLSQINIFPHRSVEIREDQVTDAVANLTSTSRKVLILKNIIKVD